MGSEPYRPSVGTWIESGLVHARVWAPRREQVWVELEGADGAFATVPLTRDGEHFHGVIRDAKAGDRYRIRVDQQAPVPDPASRFQPDGVHGSSQIVDALTYQWNDADWKPALHGAQTIYELHLGTFTPEGTWAAATRRLPWLNQLGLTAVEVMPVADWAGRWNWGYDGVALFAPAHQYGTPDEMRGFVDAAHQHGLAVILDVVYNHLGPDGAYLPVVSPRVFTDRHHTPWGAALNFDGPDSTGLRAWYIANALHWIHEYHVDGLRLDATHAIIDDSPTHLLAQMAREVRESTSRDVLLIAEDNRNLDRLVRPAADGGYGLDAVWSDDFHHLVRRIISGDHESYFADFRHSTADLALSMQRGWLYTGQYSTHAGGPRGTPSAGLPPTAFVLCLQNHDQVGNRAMGDRLNQSVDAATWRALSVLLLATPESVLLFMGQEWSASTPFQYFTDHEPELGAKVTEGRRKEFAAFAAYRSASKRSEIPDPQSPDTFARSRLDWDELSAPAHAAVLELYRDLLALRRERWSDGGWDAFRAWAVNDDAVILSRTGATREERVLIQLRSSGEVGDAHAEEGGWRVVLHTEHPRFGGDARPEQIAGKRDRPVERFARPGAVIMERDLR